MNTTDSILQSIYCSQYHIKLDCGIFSMTTATMMMCPRCMAWKEGGRECRTRPQSDISEACDDVLTTIAKLAKLSYYSL